MAALNPLTREIVFKIVFYGPGLGGKTTTLQYIHAATKPEHRGKMVSLATPTDRTLYFDYLPIRIPRVRGMGVRLQLFTVPGQVHYAATRRLVLSGTDGIVFVADSQEGRLEANRESLEDLSDNLWEHNRKLADVPHTFHWNKRDLNDLVPIEELEQAFNPSGVPSLQTVATRGDGVFSGLERITRLVLRAYEAALPGPSGVAPGLGATELGIEDAIRSLTAPPAVEVQDGPRSLTMPWSPNLKRAFGPSEDDDAPADPAPDKAAPVEVAPIRGSARETLPPEADLRALHEQVEATHASAEPQVSPPFTRASGAAPSVIPANPQPSVGTFSMAEMWPEAERESVRRTESLLAAVDATNAILACDILVTRVLASAAALSGAVEAPRDPGVVALLLGLSGGHFLAFRAAVRAARQQHPVSIAEAYECYSFVIEARRARDSIRR